MTPRTVADSDKAFNTPLPQQSPYAIWKQCNRLLARKKRRRSCDFRHNASYVTEQCINVGVIRGRGTRVQRIGVCRRMGHIYRSSTSRIKHIVCRGARALTLTDHEVSQSGLEWFDACKDARQHSRQRTQWKRRQRKIL